MLSLSLVRHAKSSWNHPELSDFERPLNERGRRDAPAMAQRLKQLQQMPDLLLSSPALRAITTARVFARELGIPPESVQLSSRIYEAELDTLVDLVRGFDSGVQHALMFGHNPGFSDLARWLASGPLQDLPTCAIVTLELPIRTWADLCPGRGRLLSYLYPKDGAD